MLLPRPQYSNRYAGNAGAIRVNPNMSIAMQHQQHHINQLLTTAAAGTGVVGDVDALLTPIPTAATVVNTSKRADSNRPERNLWRIDEIIQMLNIMQKMKAMELLNDKTLKSEKIFKNIEELMKKSGYRKKSHVQIWTKWKFLKSTYTTSRRNCTVPKVIPYQVYEVLHQMLGSNLSDCGNSATSVDGDNSNSGRIVISGVEGGYNNSGASGKAKAGGAGAGNGDSEDETGFGMAHPIFGFRLGLVKQEPVDTGYETNTNNGESTTADKDQFDENTNQNSSCSSTTNIHFQTEIKQEIVEEPIITPDITAKPSIEIQEDNRPTQITPISATHSPTSAPKPKPPLTPSQLSPQVSTIAKIPQLPPLRIAPFAKLTSAASNAVNLPPPPLSMHPTPTHATRQRTHAAAAHPQNNNNNNNNQNSSRNSHLNTMVRKILPKMAPHPTAQTTAQQLRLSKEITVHTRASAANILRLKQVSMRRAPYSLRPDCVIPDLNTPSEMPLQFSVYQDGPTTSKHASLEARQNASTLGNNKKKRLLDTTAWNNANDCIPPNKLPHLYPPPSTNISQEYHGDKEDFDAGDDDDDENSFNSSTKKLKFKTAAAQQNQRQHQQQQSNANDRKPSVKEMEFFDSALKDLGVSLRQMQREMLADFYKQQMELARKEHEFQMKQDYLIMQAFQQQTHQLMKRAKDLLGDYFENADELTNEKTKKKAAERVEKKQQDTAHIIKVRKELTKRIGQRSETAIEEKQNENGVEIAEEDGEEDGQEAGDDNDDDENNDDNAEDDESHKFNNENEQLDYDGSEYLMENSAERMEPQPDEEDNDDNAEDDDDDDDEDEDDDEADDEDDDDDDEDDDDGDGDGDNDVDNNDNDGGDNGAEDGEAEEDSDEDDEDEDEDNETDPTQLVSSELVEDN